MSQARDDGRTRAFCMSGNGCAISAWGLCPFVSLAYTARGAKAGVRGDAGSAYTRNTVGEVDRVSLHILDRLSPMHTHTHTHRYS